MPNLPKPKNPLESSALGSGIGGKLAGLGGKLRDKASGFLRDNTEGTKKETRTAIDVRNFYAGGDLSSYQTITMKEPIRSLTNTIGNIGDLEVLNDIGASQIGAGMRTLSSISNMVRLDKYIQLPGGEDADDAGEWVMDKFGVSTDSLSVIKRLQPAIANRAYGEAGIILNKIKGGNLKFKDMPSMIGNIKTIVGLSKKMFAKAPDVDGAEEEYKRPTHHAGVYAIYNPTKYKFLFAVQFILNDDCGAVFGDSADVLREFSLLVKNCSRPTVRYELDNVNMYNYRTSVVKGTHFEPIMMQMYDDDINRTMDFYRGYVNAISPITRDPDNLNAIIGTIEEQGLGSGLSYTSPLENGHVSIFKEIRLYHFFDYGKRMNVYHFFNPRIREMELDELDMTLTAAPEIVCRFVYDALHIETVSTDPTENDEYDITELTDVAGLPITYDRG